jgi:hypothetical protein
MAADSATLALLCRPGRLIVTYLKSLLVRALMRLRRPGERIRKVMNSTQRSSSSPRISSVVTLETPSEGL